MVNKKEKTGWKTKNEMIRELKVESWRKAADGSEQVIIAKEAKVLRDIESMSK